MSLKFHPSCRKCVTCALHGSKACGAHATWYDNPRAGSFEIRAAVPVDGHRPEISKRVSARIDAVGEELRRLLVLFSRKGDMMAHGQVKAALLAAAGNVKRARMLHTVPLVEIKGGL